MQYIQHQHVDGLDQHQLEPSPLELQQQQTHEPAAPKKSTMVRLHKEAVETLDKMLGPRWKASDVSLSLEYFGALLEKDENVLAHFRSHVAKLNFKKRIKSARRREREDRRLKRKQEEEMQSHMGEMSQHQQHPQHVMNQEHMQLNVDSQQHL